MMKPTARRSGPVTKHVKTKGGTIACYYRTRLNRLATQGHVNVCDECNRTITHVYEEEDWAYREKTRESERAVRERAWERRKSYARHVRRFVRGFTNVDPFVRTLTKR